MDPIVIVGHARTPMGGFQGELSSLTAPQLGAAALSGALNRAGVAAGDIEEVIMGCVLPAGLGQAPARQASRGAGLPDSAGATTINKMCGSGMKAIMLAHDLLLAGSAEVIAAGGMESMTNAPYLLARARAGLRMGHATMVDSMFLDGLEDAYDKGRLMGTFAQDAAEHYAFTRADQDAYALTSLERALKARFTELAPLEVKGKSIIADEQPAKAQPDKIPRLKPAFREGGTVTAANSSSISDGAAALILMRRSQAERRGLTPVATILGHATFAQKPAGFTTAPVGAIQRLLERVGWRAGEVDLWEINEAFAVVAMIAMRDLGLAHDTVNVHGGACALGHPIGASGARIVTTLISALQGRGLKRGVASLCIGGGEATALALEVA